MNSAFSSELFMKTSKGEEKEIREDMYPGLGVNLNPPEWQPLPTAKPCLL